MLKDPSIPLSPHPMHCPSPHFGPVSIADIERLLARASFALLVCEGDATVPVHTIVGKGSYGRCATIKIKIQPSSPRKKGVMRMGTPADRVGVMPYQASTTF